jgi:transposase-like protein
MAGKSTRKGTYKCYQCRKPFTVRIGTIFEASHLPLHVWLQAIYLVAFGDDRVSVSDLRQTLGVAPKTAALLAHRIRRAIRNGTDPSRQLSV